MPEWTIGEMIGFGVAALLVIGATVLSFAACDRFKRDVQQGLYSSSLPEVDEASIPPMPEVKPAREEYDPRLLNLAIERGWTLPSVADTHGAAAWNRYWADKEKAERGEILGRPVAPHRSGGGDYVA